MTADKQGKEEDNNRQRNADISKFEESESRQACCRQSACDDNVWRGTDHGDGTAYVGSNRQRHQLTRLRNFGCLADTNNYGHKTGYCTRIGRYRRQNDGNEHNCAHEWHFFSTRFFDYTKTNRLSKTSSEHSSADNKHTAKEYHGGVGQTGINLF